MSDDYDTVSAQLSDALEAARIARQERDTCWRIVQGHASFADGAKWMRDKAAELALRESRMYPAERLASVACERIAHRIGDLPLEGPP